MHKHIKLDHVISFGDAIFAFSITFMAISIQIPNLSEDLTQGQVIDGLLGLRSHFEIYTISFFIIGIYWIGYHQIFNHIIESRGVSICLTATTFYYLDPECRSCKLTRENRRLSIYLTATSHASDKRYPQDEMLMNYIIQLRKRN